MADFETPSFDDGPRHESPGERIQRYAGNIGLLQKHYGLDMTADEREKLAEFLVEVTSHLTHAEMEELAETLADGIKFAITVRAFFKTGEAA